MKLLNLEESEADHQLILHHLKKSGIRDVISRRVSTEEELHEALLEDKWNVVISEYNLSTIDPITALRKVRQHSLNLPFVMVSGLVGEESVVEMMKAGVSDFVIKSRLERLGPVIKRSLREVAVHEQEARSRTIAKRAMAAKEEMLAIVYHDIKNPLSAIQLDAQLLELLSQRDPGPDVMRELRTHAQRVLRTADRLKVLVADLLEHNNPFNESSVETFTIRKSFYNPLHIIHESLDSFKPLIQEKNLLIKKIILQKKMNALLDKERIHQVLSNIFSNALKFTPPNGEICVELTEDDNGDTYFSVSDNGPGIDPEDLPHIFEKYWTGGSGNGLGLYICKSIVEAHGGQLNVVSEKNKGATFSFRIPFGGEESMTDQGVTLKMAPALKRNEIVKTIYLIDDDHDLREVMSWALEKEGYRVLAYDNPLSALSALDNTFFHPDLIVLDFHMDQMKGSEFLVKLNNGNYECAGKCPVVMISAAPEEARRLTGEKYLSDIVSKPVDLNQLLKTVKRYL